MISLQVMGYFLIMSSLGVEKLCTRKLQWDLEKLFKEKKNVYILEIYMPKEIGVSQRLCRNVLENYNIKNQMILLWQQKTVFS